MTRAATYQGEDCVRQHGGIRYVQNKACVVCRKEMWDRIRPPKDRQSIIPRQRAAVLEMLAETAMTRTMIAEKLGLTPRSGSMNEVLHGLHEGREIYVAGWAGKAPMFRTGDLPDVPRHPTKRQGPKTEPSFAGLMGAWGAAIKPPAGATGVVHRLEG